MRWVCGKQVENTDGDKINVFFNLSMLKVMGIFMPSSFCELRAFLLTPFPGLWKRGRAFYSLC